MASTSTPRSLAYQPLSDASNDIRILVIQRSPNPNDQICCRLEHVPLAATSDYIALSYCWGRPDKTVPVRINGITTYITPSLADALTVLRERKYKRVWADAICINQDDMEERSRQVLRMAAIYRSASAVLARPGDADSEDVNALLRLIPDVEKLLKFDDNYDPLRFQDTPDGRASRDRALRRIIRRVRHRRDHKLRHRRDHKQLRDIRWATMARRHIRDNLQDRRWEALARLLRCDYWSRVWIIQELAMANRLQVVWGTQSFSFTNIALLVVAFNMLRGARLVGHLLPAKACLHIKNLMKFQSLQRQLTAVPLIRALRMASFAKATDARDRVYSLTGLTYDGAIVFPTPSYGRELVDINREATLRIIQVKDSLDHVVFRSVPPGSWVIDWFNPETWSDSRVFAYLTGKTRFMTGDGTLTTWAASGSSRPRANLKDGHLEVKGTIIDTIRDCSATYDERKSKSTPASGAREKSPVKRSSRLQIHRCFYFAQGDEEDLVYQEDFFAGISHSLATAKPGEYSGGLLKWMSCSLNSSLTIGGYSLRKWFEPARHSWFEWMRSGRRKEQRAHDATAMARRTLKLGMRLGETVMGRLGWFTKYARPGDKVAVISGCSVPVVLRPLLAKNRYMVVGDSIIPDIMGGEMASVLSKESVILLD